MDTAIDPETGDDVGSPASPPSRRWWPIALGMLAVVLLAASAFRIVSLMSDRDQRDERITQLEESLRIARGDAGEQIEALELEVEMLEAQIAQLDAALSATLRDLGAADDEVAGLTSRLDERRAERDEALARIDELEAIVDVVGTTFVLMPDLLGVPIETVEEFATDAGVDLVIEEVAPTNVIARPGDVIEQLPLEDTPLLPNAVIWVQVFTPETNAD